ncbi:MAG: TrkH family potassium uptake protein, partial [Bifidobacteriaceae bacterium]|nr:TrkH family potassium uptake protein [Bifidobacteriaceae bacterium]
PARLAVLVFLCVIVVVSALLALPCSTRTGKAVSLVDALFTATSAVCVTGLEVVPTGDYWSGFGQAVLLVAIQVGGLGVMTIGAILGLLVTRRLGLTQRMLTASETRSGLGQVGALVRAVALTSVVIELVIAAALFSRFTALDHSRPQAAWHAIFYGVSAFNNAGFTPSVEGLRPHQADWLVLCPIMVGVFVGALGFPVILNIARHLRQPRRWALHTKLTLTTAGLLALVAPILIGAFEWNDPRTMGSLSVPTKILNALFAGLVPRTAGFNLLPETLMEPQSLLTQEALMFVGGGSASTAGGIKVTTLAVMLLAIRAEARGDRDIEAFGRRISPAVLRAAVGVAVAGAVIVVTGALVLMPMTSARTDYILFEVTSAFGTCGLSTGLSATLPVAGKSTLIALMLIGRLGTMTLAAALAIRNRRSLIRLPEERPIVG